MEWSFFLLLRFECQSTEPLLVVAVVVSASVAVLVLVLLLFVSFPPIRLSPSLPPPSSFSYIFVC